MADHPAHLIKPARHPAPSPPPKNRLTDDILAHLAPRTVVHALTNATGALRSCMNGASMGERDFTIRTAIASKSIWEWVEELQGWPWPSEPGPAGFEMPKTQPKSLPAESTDCHEEDDDYMGSLPAKEVATYEKRLTQIQFELDNLEIEDIKAHVLNNHILPLSRPGTPLSEFTKSGMLSSSSYNRMEDLTAVITAIVVQALPNLAKLSRLQQSWTLRITVLRRVPPLLIAIEDAEMVLQSGWNAISLPPKKVQEEQVTEHPSPRESTLLRKDFDVMRNVLEKKVSHPGRNLDYMLDCLEGLPDTLPDEWLDRMESVEQSYAEWVAASERQIRETEWATLIRAQSQSRSPSPVKKSVDAGEDSEFFNQDATFIAEESSSDCESSLESDVEIGPIPFKLPRPQGSAGITGDPRKFSGISEAETIVPASRQLHTLLESEPESESESPSVIVTDDADELEQQQIGIFNGASDIVLPSVESQPPTPTNHIFPDSVCSTPRTPGHSSIIDSKVVGNTPSYFDREKSPDLPPLQRAIRHFIDETQGSFGTQRTSFHFDGLSSDLPEVSASPKIHRNRIREAQYMQASPPSSPPLEADARELSIPPYDSPLMAPSRNDDDFLMPNSAIDDSFNDDFDDSISLSEFTHSFDRRDSVGEQHLQRQIKEIISGIPAKIKLSTDPPPINLNPPDLQLPRIRKKPSVEPFRRSTSALSSRAGTPSFTLSPAKHTRPRNRNHQEIKVYHLSRSTGEAPIKLFIRCVGEHGERVMVRVGGGWADLGEYLKDYASHHKRRSASGVVTKVEVKEQPHVTPSGRRSNMGSSPAARPASALEISPMAPLAIRKTRRSMGAVGSEAPHFFPRTPARINSRADDTPFSGESNRSRSGSHCWTEDDNSFLGLAGPTGKKVAMSEENKAWVESVKEKVRLASGERRLPSSGSQFGELGKVGGTKRLFRKPENGRESRGPR